MMLRQYVRVIGGFITEVIPQYVYNEEVAGWKPGDPSRIGLQVPLEEFNPPELLPTIHDVTDIDPQPKELWTYDEATGTFSPPVPPYIDPRPQIIAELDQIDRDSARHLRALIIASEDLGVGSAERSELEALELRAIDLRAQLEALSDPQQP